MNPSSKIICFANNKSGSGKTTSIILLADFLLKSKYTVALVDTTVELALSNYIESSPEHSQKHHVFTNHTDNIVNELTKLKQSYDYIIIETESGAYQDNQLNIFVSIIENSHYIFIPVQPGFSDYDYLEHFYNFLFNNDQSDHSKTVYAYLNRINNHSFTETQFESLSFSFLKNGLKQHSAIQSIASEGSLELADKAHREAELWCNEILQILTG